MKTNHEPEKVPGVILLNHLPMGGITDYLHHQANALVELGVPVLMVGVIGTEPKEGAKYEFLPFWLGPKKISNRLLRRLLYAWSLIRNMRSFAKLVAQRPEKQILLGGFFEYLAPFWSGVFQGLRRQGKRFFAVIHDPVRDFVVGPKWWHNYSIRCAYSILEAGFVHGTTSAVEGASNLPLVTVPIGQFPFATAVRTGHDLRQELDIPENGVVMLSFGHLRDGKNLDLLIRAMEKFPNIYLIVAGKEQSEGQRPAKYYQELAKELGIFDRCHFAIRFIEDNEVAMFFNSSNIIAIAYSSKFRSASSVLGTCAEFRVPCLASSGEGPLKEAIEKYELGIWVAPDSVQAIEEGIAKLISEGVSPRWNEYVRDNSWHQNACLVRDTMLRNFKK